MRHPSEASVFDYYHLFSKYFLSEDLFHAGHVVVADGHLHAQRGGHQLKDGAQLVTMEVDGHQQQHLPKRGSHTTRTATKSIR